MAAVSKYFWQTYETETNPFTDFIIPMKMYVDKTGCVSNERFSLEPVMFSTAVLKNQFNQNATSYFLLGCITDPGNVSSAKKAKANQTKDGRGRSLRDYHACLKVLLEPLHPAQNERPLLDVCLGNQVCHVRGFLPISIVMGDGLRNDTFAGRVKSYSGTLCLTRSCFLPSHLASNPRHSCFPVSVASVEPLTCAVLGNKGTEKELSWLEHLQILTTVTSRNILKAAARRCQKIAQDILYDVLGQHKLDNAFFQVSFGDSFWGSFGSTPTDLMHALEEGII
jgi:hypothetical protein